MSPDAPDSEDVATAFDRLRKRYALLCAASRDITFVHDGKVVLDVSGSIERLLGYRPEEIIGGSPFGPWLHPAVAEEVRVRVAQGFQGRYEVEILKRDGSAVPVALSVRETGDGDERLRVVVIQDLRPEIDARRELEQSDARLRTLLEVAFDGMVVHRDGLVITANEGFARMCGYTLPEVIGMTPGAVVTPESVEIIARNIREGRTEPYLVTGVRRDGSRFPMQIQGRHVPGADGIRVTGFRDLTRQLEQEEQQERLTRQLVQAQKLEGLGVMAGGIAHDFNNLLTVMLANIELASMEVADPVLTRRLQQVTTAGRRAADLTEQMLSYAGRVPGAPVSLDLSEVVEETGQLLKAAVPQTASFTLDLEQVPLPVLADRARLGQVVMNLITNAGEALVDGRGAVRVATRLVKDAAPWVPLLAGGTVLPPGACALLSVEDTGAGLTPDEQARVFDPFYTTRFEGRGLGLATVLGVVQASGGAVAVESSPGKGSVFSVLLPVSRVAVEPREAAVLSARRFKGCAALVDDDPLVRDTAAELLCSLGWTVHAFSSGEALLEAMGGGLAPDVVVLDWIMPGLGGAQTLAVLTSMSPAPPVLIISGREDLRGRDPERGRLAFLAKPFTLVGLSSALVWLGVPPLDG